MPGPRAGYSGVIVRVRDERSGVEVERLGSEVASPLVHRSCQSGSDCAGAGCRVRTGKTNGTLSSDRLWRERARLAIERREATQRAATVAMRAVYDAA